MHGGGGFSMTRRSQDFVIGSAAAQSPRRVEPLDVQPLADGKFDAAYGPVFF
jgi:hypothetical protein